MSQTSSVKRQGVPGISVIVVGSGEGLLIDALVDGVDGMDGVAELGLGGPVGQGRAEWRMC